MTFKHVQFPKISIVTPNYNYGHFLETTIQSVLSQNYPNLEYIIIDGGSTDNSIEIIKKYESQLTYWCSGKDNGMYDAINKGFSQATGEIMAWINSDDIYFPWALRDIAEVFAKFPEVNWVSTLQPGLMDYSGKILQFEKIPGFSYEAFLDNQYGIATDGYGSIQQESTFWRKSLWDRTGGAVNTNIKLAADFELWSRFFKTETLYGLISPLGCYRIQDQQKTKAVQAYRDECIAVLAKTGKPKTAASITRKLLKSTRLSKLPAVGWRLSHLKGYKAINIVREHANTADATWSKKHVTFL